MKQCRDNLLKIKKKNISPAETVSQNVENYSVPPNYYPQNTLCVIFKQKKSKIVKLFQIDQRTFAWG